MAVTQKITIDEAFALKEVHGDLAYLVGKTLIVLDNEGEKIGAFELVGNP